MFGSEGALREFVARDFSDLSCLFRGNAMSTIPKFRIDVNVHSLLMNPASDGPERPVDQGVSLPEPIYPRFPEKLSDPGPDTPPEHREWTLPQAYRSMRGGSSLMCAPEYCRENSIRSL